jgi:hypothetical protein
MVTREEDGKVSGFLGIPGDVFPRSVVTGQILYHGFRAEKWALLPFRVLCNG